MLYRFQKYVEQHKLFAPTDKVLACVSGGIDSMVLLRLLLEAGYRRCLAVAHCNFGLRGAESDGDERLVRQLCEAECIPFYSTRFDTLSYASEQGISTQMAARELRYGWFYELAAVHGFDKIAVAHNANDEVETFFLNLARGTGLRGLTGIAAEQGRVVRPLLFASRGDIERYASEHGVSFREDSSNSSDKYARNSIRHHVIPLMTELNPSFLSTMQGNMSRLQAAQQLLEGMTEQLRKRACVEHGDELKISIEALPKEQVEFWLFELLHDYNFSGAVLGDVARALHGRPGRLFYSPTHALLKDRSWLLVRPVGQERGDGERLLERAAVEQGLDLPLADGGRLRLSLVAAGAAGQPSPRAESLDYDKLQFPLRLRRWKAGDSFVPLGMRGKKKLSDFFTDIKLNRMEKQEQQLLCSANGDIALLVGRRVDERYRIGPQTQRVLRVELVQ